MSSAMIPISAEQALLLVRSMRQNILGDEKDYPCAAGEGMQLVSFLIQKIHGHDSTNPVVFGTTEEEHVLQVLLYDICETVGAIPDEDNCGTMTSTSGFSWELIEKLVVWLLTYIFNKLDDGSKGKSLLCLLLGKC